MTDEIVRTAGRPLVINRAVVGTITVTSILIVYDGWARVDLLDVIAIIVGPVVAMFIAHVFAGGIAVYAARGGSVSKEKLLATVRAELGWLLLGVPPTTLLLVLRVIGVELDDAIRVVIWFGAASLGFWAGLAGRRAGMRGGHLVFAVALGLLVGGAVLMLQVFLQPGTAVSNGVAAVGSQTAA